MTHARYTVQLGERGRLVLPAPLRRELLLQEGSQLVVELEGGVIRMVPAGDVADGARGMLADDDPDRSLVDELLAERQAEAGQDVGVTIVV